MNRAEALKLLALDHRPLPEGEAYTADYFRPEDAPGVARLFYAVYGDGYPIDTYYIPELLIEENRRGSIRSVVARTDSGEIVTHVALYRSSPPNPNFYEYGVGLTLPAYRMSMAFARANQLLIKLLGHDGVDGFYGEAVCNHVTTQKLCKQTQSLETALEPALMPAEAYKAEKSAAGRVGCMVYSRVARDRRRMMHVPDRYDEEIKFILGGLNLDRQLVYLKSEDMGGSGEIDVKRYDFAGVARCSVREPGDGIQKRLAELDQELRKDNYALVQFFIDLGKPWSIRVVEQLHGQGYCFGGLIPIWFGDDGLLMQKHFVDPDFDGLKILNDRGRRIVEMVRRDWERRTAQEV